MFARPGFQHAAGVTKTQIVEALRELPLIHETVEQEIQGGKAGQHYHLTAAQHAFLTAFYEIGLVLPDVKIYEPVCAGNEIIFADGGDCVMAWGGLIQELGSIEAAPPPPIPPGEVDARFTWANHIASKEPGEGATTLNTVIFISNTVTGVVSPIPSGRTFSIAITCPDKFVGTKTITSTTSSSTTSEWVIADLISSFSSLGLGAYGFTIATESSSSLRLTGPTNTYVGRALSNDGIWRLAQTIYSEGSPGFSGNPKLVRFYFPTVPIDPGETLQVDIGSYEFKYTALAGQTGAQILMGLAAVIDEHTDWTSYYDPLYGCVAMPLSGTYGTHPWVNYTPLTLVSPAP